MTLCSCVRLLLKSRLRYPWILGFLGTKDLAESCLVFSENLEILRFSKFSKTFVSKSGFAKKIWTFEQEKVEMYPFLRSSKMSVLLRNVQNIWTGNEHVSC